MKQIFQTTCLLGLVTIILTTCGKWDLDKINFTAVKTGSDFTATLTTATVEGEIVDLGDGKIIEHGHLYSCVNPQPEFGQSGVESALLGITFEGGTFSNVLEDLTLNTTYYVRAFALLENATEPVYGETIEFRLGDNILKVTTDSVDLFTGGFDVYGTLSDLQEGVILSQYGFVYSTENEMPDVNSDPVSYLGLLNTDKSFHIRIDNIEQLKTYHVRAFAQLGKEVFYGETKSFFKGDVWVQKEDGPAASKLYGCFSYVIGEEVYIGGGYAAQDSEPVTSFFKYTPLSDSWETLASLNGFVVFGAAFGIGDSLYAVAGLGNNDNAMWTYSIGANTWSQRDNLINSFRFDVRAITIQGKGYFGFGRGGTGEVYENMWVYDPQTGSVNEIPTEIGSRVWPVPFLFAYESELIVGFGPSGADRDLWSYNTNNSIWTEKDYSPLPDFSPKNIRGFCIGNKGYIVSSKQFENFWEYNMSTNQWTRRADYPGILKRRPVAFAANGKGYIGLGLNINSGLSSTTKDMWEYIPDIEDL